MRERGWGVGTNLLTLSPLPHFNFNVINLKLGHRANNQIKYTLNLPNRQTNSPKRVCDKSKQTETETDKQYIYICTYSNANMYANETEIRIAIGGEREVKRECSGGRGRLP